MVYSQKTKIVATIGPNTANPSMLKKMYSAGMSLARLNGSHNTLDWHESTIKLIKKTLPDCPILLDIPGKKIRTSKLIYEPKFQQGDIVILTTVKGHNGKKKVSITNNKLHLHLSKGDIVFADDGTLKFIVIKVVGKDIYLRALSSEVDSLLNEEISDLDDRFFTYRSTSKNDINRLKKANTALKARIDDLEKMLISLKETLKEEESE